MNPPAPNSLSRLRATLALAALLAALAVPSAALGQDPAADQYAPTAPSGGGNLPTAPNNHSDPNPTSTPDGTQPSGSNIVSPGDTSSTSPSVPDATATINPPDQGNKAQRTVGKIAAAAQQSRDAGPAVNGPQAATELLRTDNAAGSGMGVFLWIVLGGTLLWAIASGASSFRNRRSGDGGPAPGAPGAGSTGGQPA